MVLAGFVVALCSVSQSLLNRLGASKLNIKHIKSVSYIITSLERRPSCTLIGKHFIFYIIQRQISMT